MSKTTEFLTTIRRTIKLHESMLKKVCEEYQLTLIEATIISFLHNNPEKDTAADIVELRMLQKGNVSQAVESLTKKSLLQRKPDEMDRRKIHLFMTEEAEPIVQSIEGFWKAFQEEIFAGISVEEQEVFERINERIKMNTQRAMEKREQERNGNDV